MINMMLKEVSKKLMESKVFHKSEKDFIITRKTKIKIPNMNKDIAYLTGVIAGDGSLIKSKRKKGGYYYELKIYANCPDYLEKINSIFEKEFNIRGTIIKDKRKKRCFVLTIKNAAIFHYFMLIDAKYHKNKIPSFLEKNKELFLNYMAGIIDTDGSISGKRIQLKLKNKGVIEDIFKKLKEKNIQSNSVKINYTKSIPFYYIRFDNKFPLRLKNKNLYKL